MSRSLGNRLPEEILSFLQSCPDTIVGQALVLLTIDSSGFAHPALLSILDVDAVSPGHILVVCGAQSRTADNLQRRGLATLLLEWEKRCFYLKMKLNQRRDQNVRCVALLEVGEVLEDQPARGEQHSEVRGLSFAGLSPAVVRQKLEDKVRLRGNLAELFGVLDGNP